MDIWNGPWSPHASHHGGYFETGEAEPAGQPEAGPSNYQQRAQLNEVHPPPVDTIEHDSRSNNGSEPQQQLNPRQRSSNSILSLDAGKAREKRSIPTEGRDIPGEDEEDDEEEQVCRICRCGPEPDQPLFHPCKCTGSIRYTHQDCLKDWLSHSRKDKCELCDYPFVFRKIYDAHMPSKLPGGLRAAFFAKKSAQFAIVALRALLVVAIWLALVPWALIKFFKGSLWIVDLLIAAAGGGSSTWTNVSSGALTSASEALFSSSAPAAPSPTAMPPRPSAPSLALTFSGQALIGSVISFGFYATPWAGLGGGVSLLLDWALRAEKAGVLHDIFLGQVLTCVIIVLLLAGWFTREWIVMQMPAQLPEQLRDEREEQGPAQPAVQDVPPPPMALPQVPNEEEAAGPQPQENGPDATNDLMTYGQLMAELERRSAELSAQMDEEQRQWLDGDAEVEDGAEGSHTAQQEQRGTDSGEEQADGPASIEELRRARLAAFGRNSRDEEPIEEAAAGSSASPVEEPDFEPDYARRLLAANEYRAPRAGRRASDIATDSDTATEGDHLGDAQEHEPLLAGPNPADVRFALAAVQERAAAGQQNGNAAAAAAQEAAAAAEAEAAAAAADAADFDGDVDGMLEAIGFRGDPVHLLANVSIVVALCSFCIIVGVTMPYLLGRVFGLGKGFLDVVTAPVRMIRWVTDPVFDAAINLVMGKGGATQDDNVESSVAQVWQQVVKLVQPSTASTTAPGPTPTPFNSAVSALLQKMRTLPVDIVQPIEERLVRADASIANRALCVGIGHFWWMGQIALRVVFEEVMKRRHPRPEWWLREFIGQVLIVVKVLVFLAIELILFPIGCGLILDACTFPLRGVTLSTALTAPLLKPLSFTYMRWAVGTLWMFRIGLYVSHIRSLVRPGVMSWIRDPEDPDFQPIKEILERKSFTQLRKIGASAVMYASLILALVGFNVHLAHRMWKDVLPLRLPQRSLAPYDFLAVLFLVPVANPERLEDALAWVSRKWWRAAAGALRLDGYFFGDFPTTTTTTTTDEDYKIRGTPTFLARIPASDNAIIGTPPLIYLDGKTGEAISERGKEAIRDQEAKIRAMPEPKAKYVSVRLPTNFARRVRALLVLLWASMSVGLHALLGALVLGRRVLDGHEGRERQLHDGYAFAAGCATLALPATVAWSLYIIIGTIKRKRNAALKLRRAARKAAGLIWLIVALGFVSPAVLGIAIDQVILSHLRASTTQTSLLYAWSLGLLTQELYVQCLDWLPQDSRLSVAVQDLQRRGLRRLRVWPATRDIFFPITAISLAAIALPLLITAAVNASTKSSSNTKESEALYLGRLIVLAAGLAVLGVRLVAAHLERFDRELRDEVYLRISQLRNYKGTSGRSGHRGHGHGHGRRRRRGQRQWVPEDDEPMSEDSGSVSGSATGVDGDEVREDERFDDAAPAAFGEVQDAEEEETGDETLGDWEETEEAEEVQEIG